MLQQYVHTYYITCILQCIDNIKKNRRYRYHKMSIDKVTNVRIVHFVLAMFVFGNGYHLEKEMINDSCDTEAC